MPGDEWTVATLKSLLERTLSEMDKRHAAQLEAIREQTKAAFASSEKAILKAEAASERRFESVNEFRAALSDQGRLMMPRIETETLLNVVNEKIEDLRKQMDVKTGSKRGGDAMLGYAIGVCGVITAIIAIGFHLLSH